MKLIPVKFLKRWRVYSKGEIAGFSEEIVADLIKQGIAEAVKVPAKAK